MDEIKKVSLIGLGAIGSFFAPRLYNWLDKGNFRVIADGERKERLETRGLTVNDINYKFPVITPDYDKDTSDLIIISVKSTALDQAIKDIKNQVGPDTLILCILNGIDNEEKVASVYGWEHVLYSYMYANIEMKNSIVKYSPSKVCVHFGEATNHSYSDRVLKVKQLFDTCNISYQISEDMLFSMWYKYLANLSINMAGALLSLPIGAIFASEHASAIVDAIIDEAIEVANAKGINITKQDFKEQEESFKKIKDNTKPSSLTDLDNKKPTEVDVFSGAIMNLGNELGINTPVNTLIYHAIKAYEEKNKGLI